MNRARVLAVVVLLLSYGAVGARQPAVRVSVPLPAPAAQIADTLGLPSPDRSRVVVDIVRLIFDSPDGNDSGDARLRQRLNALLGSKVRGELAPLPLDPSIWRDTLLQRQVRDDEILAAVLSDRRTALLYHGLAALDDETLAWLGPDRELLANLLTQHSGTFAVFARSIRVKGGRVQVPGGASTEKLWTEIVGAPPTHPSDFVRRLFSKGQGHLAFLYDSVAQLDEPSRQFALAGHRVDRVRALEQQFQRVTFDLKPRERPFFRPFLDPFLTLGAIEVTDDGAPVGPTARGLWDLVFKYEDLDEPLKDAAAPRSLDSAPIDAAWIVSRVHKPGPISFRRRLDAVLFGQRVFRNSTPSEAGAVASALRGMLAFPTLMLTLERAGVRSPAIYAAAVARAHALNSIGDDRVRHAAVVQFQTSLAIVERMVRMGGLTPESGAAPINALLAIDFSQGDGVERVSSWLVERLKPSLAGVGDDSSLESAVLAGMAGWKGHSTATVEWEGRRYRVSPPEAEFGRLRRVRSRQGGPSLDDVIAVRGATNGDRGKNDANQRRERVKALNEVLASIVYAAYLGDPKGTALAAGNVALRHDLALDTGARPSALAAWRIATEIFGGPEGWMLRGSLLALDVPLAKFALRRLDETVMPPAPKLTSNERHTAALTVALMRPQVLTEQGRDHIAATLERGRERLAALASNPGNLEEIARDAGISEWRRQGLSWVVANEPERLGEQLAPVELFWLGTRADSGVEELNEWGAVALPSVGCLCLQIPPRGPWEPLSGRPSAGILATRGADVGLLVAAALAKFDLPSALAPGVAAYAMQDVLDASQPAYFDDWSQFGRAALTLSVDRFADYVAALTSGGALLPATDGGIQP